jgi:hypothetical protein
LLSHFSMIIALYARIFIVSHTFYDK